MRILYVAPRYHTNQRPIMKAMCEHHHEVFFFSQYAADNDELCSGNARNYRIFMAV